MRTMMTSVFVAIIHGTALGAHPCAAPGVTSLTNPAVKYSVSDEHLVVLKRGAITAVIADNGANSKVLPGHQSGYNGLASLTHEDQPRNLFVPSFAGLNLEHFHDGTSRVHKDLFEPRNAPMQLRIIDEHTVELYQPATPVWKIESCGRYQLLDDGTVEYTFECVPREDVFQGNFIGVFWASYIHEPEDIDIHFLGREAEGKGDNRWLKTASPKHGIDATHPPAGALPEFKFDPGFPLTLANHRSAYVHTADWYYGVCRGMAYALMFRPRDRIWLAQSPSGAGQGNPAWDFQWFVPQPKVGEAYGLVMRAAYLPFKDQAALVLTVEKHLKLLGDRARLD